MSKKNLTALIAVLMLVVAWWEFVERPNKRSLARAIIATLK